MKRFFYEVFDVPKFTIADLIMIFVAIFIIVAVACW